MKKVVSLVVLVLFSSLLVASVTSATPSYNVIALPQNFHAFTINNWNAVGGYERTYVDSYETLGYDITIDTASIWQNGNLEKLPFSGTVYDLNDAGMTWIWDDTKRVDVLYNTSNGGKVTIDNNAITSIGGGINNIDQVAGWHTTYGTWETKAVIWTPTYTMSLEIGNECVFSGINNLGHAIGNAVIAGGKKPILWNDKLSVLETPTGNGSVSDINDEDMMVGSYYASQYDPATLTPAWWDFNGTIRDLPNLGLPGAAIFVNNKGQILGQLNREWVVWDSWTTKPVFLKDIANFGIDNIEDFNDVGTILALGWQNGHYGSLLLNPTVPEPGSILALATGLIGLVGFGLRRRR